MTRRFYIITFVVGILLLGGGFYFTSQIEAQNAPVAPSDFNVEAVSSCKLKVNWTYGDIEEINFEAKRKKGSGTAIFKSIPDLSVEGSYYFTDSNNDELWQSEDVVDPIDPGESYSYQLRAYNETSGVGSDYTNFMEVTTEPLPSKPGKPTNIGLNAGEGTGNIYISWNVQTPTSTLFSDYGKFEIWHAVSSDGQSYGDLEYLNRIPSSQNDEIEYFYEYLADKDLSHKYVIYTKEVGGEGCDPDRNEHTVLSDASGSVILPARPYDLHTESTEQPERKIKLTWSDRSDETEFEIQRSLSSEFNSFASYTVSANQTEYNDTNITETGAEMYWYRIRSCMDSNCSFFAEPVPGTVGISVPQNVRGRVIYVSGKGEGDGADINIAWDEENIISGSELHIERAVGSGDFDESSPVAVIPTSVSARENRSSTFTKTSLGEIYRYRIVNVEDGTRSNPSNVVEINLNISHILQGVAWTAGEDSGGNLHGIGWVKFNSLGENSEDSTVPYSVQVAEDGMISGLAWAGEGYGWLSFNKADLGGCPTGACEASINSNGKLNGWARFLSPIKSEGDGSWNGWVHLRNEEGGYGVELYSNYYLYGAAWGGDITGWIIFGPTMGLDRNIGEGSFCPPDVNNEDKSKCTVRTTEEQGVGEILEAPRDLSVEVLSASEIQLSWYNPMAYTTAAIYRKEASDSFTQLFEPSTAVGNISYLDSNNLKGDTEYSYYIEGCDETKCASSSIVSAVTPGAKYSLGCYTLSNSAISLYWSGGDAVPENHYIQLHWATSTANPTYCKFDGDITQTSGLEAIGNLATSTLYKFKLKVFDNGNTELTSREPSGTVSCETGETIIREVPNNLKVWSVDSSTLYVNWKDNAVTPHNFTIQRIKLTPDDPKSLNVISSDGVTSHLGLSWVNETNISDIIGGKVQKGPYYHVIERTTSANPFLDTVNDPSFVSFTAEFLEDKDYGSTKTNYQKDDYNNLKEATTYWYRIKGCSYIKTDFTRDGVDNPQEICNDYSSVKSGTTAPKMPTNLVVTTIAANSVTIAWNDESQGEDGYLITTSTDPNSGFSTGEEVAADTESFVQTGLISNSNYFFRVKAYINSSSGKVYSNFVSIYSGTLPGGSGAYLKSGRFYADTIKQFKNLFSGFGNIEFLDVLKDSADKLLYRVSNIFDNGFKIVSKIKRALADETGIDLNTYFAQFVREGYTEPVLKDVNVEPDTVYLYQVKAVYTGDRSEEETIYSKEGAGKTMPDGTISTVEEVGICTRNSFCEFFSKNKIGTYSSDSQCDNNAGCRNVGTSRQFFEETK